MAIKTGSSTRLHISARHLVALGMLCLLLVLGSQNRAQAEIGLRPVDKIRTIYPVEWGVGHPAGLAYSVSLGQFFLVDSDKPADATPIVGLTPYEDLVDSASLPSATASAINIAFDDTNSRIFMLSADLTELIQVNVDRAGEVDLTTVRSLPIGALALASAQGMSVDAQGQYLYILDGLSSQIVRLVLSGDMSTLVSDRLNLAPELEAAGLRGIAVNPANGQPYVVNPKRHLLYALDQSGALVSEYDLSSLGLADPQAVTFAPSPDLTDDPATIHLFIADSPAAAQPATLGRLIEVTLDPIVPEAGVAAVNTTALALVQTIDSSTFNPPSPDPSGIDYIPETDILLVADGEVDEMSIFQNANIYGVTRQGALSYTANSTVYLDMSFNKPEKRPIAEPVGIAYDSDPDPAKRRLFISDDDKKKVYEIQPGPDNTFYTGDDLLTYFSTKTFGSNDPEGLDYDELSGHLFIADGVNREIYRVNPGPNGRFDGTAPTGDDIVTQFDLAQFGVNDPPGVYFDPDSGNLIIMDDDPKIIHEISPAAVYVQAYDISAASGRRLDGVVKAPSSDDPSKFSYYIVDRRVDNNADPNENDGRIYEFRAAGAPPPPPGDGDKIYVSSTSGGTVGAIKFADEDILVYDIEANTWGILIDGSDVGLSSLDVDAFFILNDGSMLMSVSSDATIAGFGPVDESDILRFVPTSTGTNTAGTFEMYFDGSAYGLDVSAEDVDALAVLNDGRLVMSITGNTKIGALTIKDEDLLVFNPSDGSWAFYLLGKDVLLNTVSSEDTNGVWIDPLNGDIYLTTIGAFAVNGLSGDGDDIFICVPLSANPTSSCNFHAFWDGDAHAFGSEIIDAIFIEPAIEEVSTATVGLHYSTVHSGEGDDLLADPDEGPDNANTPNDNRIFLPTMER